MNYRNEVLEDLVCFAKPLDCISESLAKLPWDDDGNNSPFLLKRNHIIDILQRYLERKLSCTDVEDWANLIEGREDLEYNSADEEIISSVVYALANPLLEEELSSNLSNELINKLSR
jgi:hypothetical protein